MWCVLGVIGLVLALWFCEGLCLAAGWADRQAEEWANGDTAELARLPGCHQGQISKLANEQMGKWANGDKFQGRRHDQEGVSPNRKAEGMNKLKVLLQSRKFWAVVVVLLVVFGRAYVPGFPLSDQDCQRVTLVCIAFILGTAIEDGFSLRTTGARRREAL